MLEDFGLNGAKVLAEAITNAYISKNTHQYGTSSHPRHETRYELSKPSPLTILGFLFATTFICNYVAICSILYRRNTNRRL